MDDKQLAELIEALTARMKTTAEDRSLWNEIRQVRKTLKEWDRQGAVPQANRLKEWGFTWADSVSPSTNFSMLELDQITKRLQERINESTDSNESDKLEAVLEALDIWQTEGLTGLVPHADQLAVWGIWPTTDQPQPDPRQSATPVAETPQPEASPVAVSAAIELSTSEPAAEMDESLQAQFNAAQAQIQAQNYVEAIRLLDELQAKSSGHLKTAINQKRQSAYTELEKLTRPLVERATEVERAHSDSLDLQEKAWHEVRRVNPGNIDAQEAISRISNRRIRRKAEFDLAELEKRLVDIQAKQVKDLPLINTLLGTAQAALKDAQSLPQDDSLSDDLGLAAESIVERANALVQQFTDYRADVRDKLGIVSTLRMEKDYREAYRLARDYVEQNVPVLPDDANVMAKGAGAEIRTREFFKVISADFIAAIKSLVSQRRATAEGQKASDPELAKQTLKSAQSMLTDEVLTMAHRQQLTELTDVTRELEEVERLIKRFDEARRLVVVAQDTGRKPAERLNSLIEAKENYPGYPRLDVYLAEAEDARATEVASEIEIVIADAQQKVKRDDFEGALNRLQAMRKIVQQVTDRPQVSWHQAQELKRLAETTDAIAAAQTAYQRMLETVSDAEAAIKRYDDTRQLDELNTARELIKHIEHYKNHPRVINANAGLTARQGDPQNWEDGQRAYAQQDWSAAKGYFGAIGGGFQQKPESDRLALYARAAESAAAAELAEKNRDPDWGTIVNQYRFAVDLFDTDSGTGKGQPAYVLVESLITRARTRLKQIESNDLKVQQALQEAAGLINSADGRQKGALKLFDQLDTFPEFKRAVDALEKVQLIPSPKTQQVQTDLSLAREKWRQVYLGAMQKALDNGSPDLLKKASERAVELRAANLLYEDADKNLANAINVAYLDSQYIDLVDEARSNGDWGKVEANRRERLRAGRTPDVEDQLREAIRYRVRSELSKRQTAEGSKGALKYLTEQMDLPIIRSDSELITEWIQLHWHNEEWKSIETAIRRFADVPALSDGPILTVVWRGLTDAARLFASNNIDLAKARLIELAKQQPDFSELIETQQGFLLGETVDRLVAEAQQSEKLNTDDGHLAAAEKYALTYTLRPDDGFVQQSLRRLIRNLTSGITARCEQASTLRISGRALGDAVKDADNRYANLKAVCEVVTQLKLDTDLQKKMEGALTRLDEKRRRWAEAQSALETFDRQLMEAVKTPRPLGRDGETGGWLLDAPRGTLDRVAKVVGRDEELLHLSQMRHDELEKREDIGRDLMDNFVRPLMTAVRTEDFDAVMQRAEALDRKWIEIQNAENVLPTPVNWDGLSVVIRYSYPWFGDVQELSKHRQMATKQKDNLTRWASWAKNVDTIRKEVKSLIDDLQTALDLEALRGEKPLFEVGQVCDKGVKACDQLLVITKSGQPPHPLSRKAEAEESKAAVDQLVLALEDETDGWRVRLDNLRKQARRDLEDLTKVGGPLARLRVAMNDDVLRRGSGRRLLGGRNEAADEALKIALQRAQNCLKDCQVIDPLHKDVIEYRKKLNDIQSKLTEA